MRTAQELRRPWRWLALTGALVFFVAAIVGLPTATAAEDGAAQGGDSEGLPPAPTGSVAPSAVSSSSSTGFEARLHERPVFSVRAPRAGQSAQDRAMAATTALDRVLDDPEQTQTRVEERPGAAEVFVGKTPIVTLGEDDAASAGGDISLHVYASGIASRIDESLRTERRRSAIAERVFSVSLLVFSALLAFLVYRRVGELAGQARAWVKSHPARIPALRLGRIEVARPASVRGALSIALALAHRIAQIRGPLPVVDLRAVALRRDARLHESAGRICPRAALGAHRARWRVASPGRCCGHRGRGARNRRSIRGALLHRCRAR